MKTWLVMLSMASCLWSTLSYGQTHALPTAETPLVVVPETKEVKVFGVIHAGRFNAARGEEAHYHLLVWQGGKSPNALIETPADDLIFHAALVKLGARPGDNLAMTSWTERHDEHSVAPLEKVSGSTLDVRIAWQAKPIGIPVVQAFRQVSQATADWHFGGNRDRPFNRIPFAPRPGCLVCLYSCPSGKVSNGALSVHDYVTTPSRFVADTDLLPPDGTPVIVIFRVFS